MTLVISRRKKRYIAHRCKSKRSRDISEKWNSWKMERFGCSLMSRERFDLQRCAIYHFSRLKKASVIGQFIFQSISFFTVKNAENETHSFLSSVFHVFNGEKWNGPEIKVAYDTRLSKTRKMIYRSPLYVKAFSRCKRTTNHVENGTLRFFTYISRTLWRTAVSDISLFASWKGECHRLL